MFALLNEMQIRNALSPRNQCLISYIELLTHIDSTNNYLLHQIKRYPRGSLVLAERQTAGKGRQGKLWLSPPGNLYASLLWHLPTHIALPPLSLAMAVMVLQALTKCAGVKNLQLKWPNDIYFAQRKLAGILIESSMLDEQTYALVIGIGINLTAPPGPKAISLLEITPTFVAYNLFIASLLNAICDGLKVYSEQGFASFQADWQSKDMLPGRAIVLHTPQYSISGVALGVNAQGELLVCDSQGKELAYHCGEVSVIV